MSRLLLSVLALAVVSCFSAPATARANPPRHRQPAFQMPALYQSYFNLYNSTTNTNQTPQQMLAEIARRQRYLPIQSAAVNSDIAYRRTMTSIKRRDLRNSTIDEARRAAYDAWLLQMASQAARRGR